MKRVFRNNLLSEVGFVRGLLEQEGIACTTKNEQLAGALGDIPFLECEPELWVIDDSDYAKAKKIVMAHQAPAEQHSPWHCYKCDELNEGQFAACWRCGHSDQSE